jgi:hypothetical protein
MLLFMVNFVVALPPAWGAGGARQREAVKPVRTRTVRAEVSTKRTMCHRPPGNPAAHEFRERAVGVRASGERGLSRLLRFRSRVSSVRPDQRSADEPCDDGGSAPDR